ncbi:MAG: hypothetical protein Q4A92_05955 [Corynebacterium sp.]|nr:hypothetical protein [Corynebacterium sp.]
MQLPETPLHRQIHRLLLGLMWAFVITSFTASNAYETSIPIAQAEHNFNFQNNHCSHVTTQNVAYCSNAEKPEISSIDIHSGEALHQYAVPQPNANIAYLGGLEELDLILVEGAEGTAESDSFAWLTAVHNGEFQWKKEVALDLHCGFTSKDASIICTEFIEPSTENADTITNKVTVIDANTGDTKSERDVTYDVSN